MAGLPTPPHYHGHRERLRGRFREAGADALSDYELLELLLFRALRRRHHRTEGRAGGGEPASPRRHQKTASAVIVVKRALELSATALILVHNHPSGDPTPSRADIQMTQAIIDVAGPLGISVHDHIIVGKDGHASLKALKAI